MKTSFRSSHRLLITLLALALLPLTATADPGKVVIGKLKGTLVYATNNPQGNAKAKPVSSAINEIVSKKEPLYKHYYLIGSDQQDIYKGYENELKPLPSGRIKLAFEPVKSSKGGTELEIDYWLGGKKTFSTKTPKLTSGTPMIIHGPKWRKGRVLIILERSK